MSASGGSGMIVRLTILIAILLTCIGIWIYDSNVRGPQIEASVEKFFNLTNLETEDGHGLPKDLVHEQTGQAPAEEFKAGDFDVERYQFSRTLPFMPSTSLYAVYKDDVLKGIMQGDRPTEEKLIEKYAGGGLKVNLNDYTGPGMRPNLPATGAGGGGGGGGNRANNDDDSKENDNGDKKEEGADDDKDDEGAGGKADDDKAESEKAESEKGDGESDDDNR
ncbi:MAG: hypothetical protein R3C03_07885 [Pirellulaceae bacterium]